MAADVETASVSACAPPNGQRQVWSAVSRRHLVPPSPGTGSAPTLSNDGDAEGV